MDMKRRRGIPKTSYRFNITKWMEQVTLSCGVAKDGDDWCDDHHSWWDREETRMLSMSNIVVLNYYSYKVLF